MSKRLTGEELLREWRRKEEELRIAREKEREEKLKNIPRQCKNCFNSWFREIPPTGSFTEATTYCGCRIKTKLVDPCGCCELFKP